MPSPVVVDNAKNLLPLAKRLWLPLLNMVGEKHEFRITITSPDYMQCRLLFGLIVFERGEKREFVLRGTEAYVSSVANALVSQGFDVNKHLIGPEKY